MSEATDKEPTMEEILASIRRIISEDGDEAETAAEVSSDATEPPPDDEPEAQAASEPSAPEPEAEPGPEPETAGQDDIDEIFELTDQVDDEEPDGSDEPEPEAAMEAAEEEQAEPETDFAAALETAAPDDGDEEEERIVSPGAELQAGASFAELSAMLVSGADGSAPTLEGLVREMLKPMMKAWLDENLPRVVEDMVAQEIARIAARHRRR